MLQIHQCPPCPSLHTLEALIGNKILDMGIFLIFLQLPIDRWRHLSSRGLIYVDI